MNTEQGWRCELCGKQGSVTVSDGDGVWEVVEGIKANHARLSPDCKADVRSLRVDNLGADSACEQEQRP